MLMFPLDTQLSVAVALPVLEGSVPASHSTSMSAGQVMTGGVVSSMVMVCVQEVALPQASVAVQVLNRVPVVPQPVMPLRSSA